MEEGGTNKVDLVICHEFYGRIGKNTVKRSGMALEQSQETIPPVYFGSCTERTAPCTWTLVQNWPQNVCPSIPAYFWKSGLDDWNSILTLSKGATTVFAYFILSER